MMSVRWYGAYLMGAFNSQAEELAAVYRSTT
jgi:hypothetical protein